MSSFEYRIESCIDSKNMRDEAMIQKLSKALAVQLGIQERIDSGDIHPDMLGDVVAFHNKFKVQNPTDRPDHQMAHSMQMFKTKHLKEELEEYEKSVATGNMVEALDALVDLAYVLFGVVHAHDFTGVFPEAWRRVHAANMSKIAATKADDSKRGFKNDIVKPEGFTPPDLSDLVGA